MKTKLTLTHAAGRAGDRRWSWRPRLPRTASRRSRPTGEKVDGAPFEVKRDWGTFKLADRIAEKVKAGEKINYVFSYQASGIPLFSPQYAAGFETGCKLGNAIYPMDCASIAPVQTDANQQVSQIEAKLAAGEIDCISIEPVTFRFDHRHRQQADGPGHPGLHRRRHLARPRVHQLHPGAAARRPDRRQDRARLDEGQQQGPQGLRRLRRRPDPVLGAGPHEGLPSRRSWRRSPTPTSSPPRRTASTSATTPARPTTPTARSCRPIPTSSSSRTSTSAPSMPTARSRASNKTGQVFTIGWNVSKGQLDGIEKGIQVAALDQRWSDQAAFGGPACAAVPEERRHPAQHPDAEAGHGRRRRRSARGTRPASSEPQ